MLSGQLSKLCIGQGLLSGKAMRVVGRQDFLSLSLRNFLSHTSLIEGPTDREKTNYPKRNTDTSTNSDILLGVLRVCRRFSSVIIASVIGNSGGDGGGGLLHQAVQTRHISNDTPISDEKWV